MDVSLIILGYGFLLMYGLNVVVNSMDTLYNIYCDVDDRSKDDDDKNKIPDSVKHMYS